MLERLVMEVSNIIHVHRTNNKKSCCTRDPRRIAYHAILVVNLVNQYEVHGEESGELTKLVYKDLPDIPNLVKAESKFEDVRKVLQFNPDDSIGWSYYRNQRYVTGLSEECLKYFHRPKNGLINTALRQAIKDILTDGSFKAILPSVMSYLERMYEEGVHKICDLRRIDDRSRNQSRNRSNADDPTDQQVDDSTDQQVDDPTDQQVDDPIYGVE